MRYMPYPIRCAKQHMAWEQPGSKPLSRWFYPLPSLAIVAAIILAISRAVGETMIVAIAAGSGPNFTFNPLTAAETMTGYIARISGGDLGYDTPDYNSIFAIGLALIPDYPVVEPDQPEVGSPFS